MLIWAKLDKFLNKTQKKFNQALPVYADLTSFSLFNIKAKYLKIYIAFNTINRLISLQKAYCEGYLPEQLGIELSNQYVKIPTKNYLSNKFQELSTLHYKQFLNEYDSFKSLIHKGKFELTLMYHKVNGSDHLDIHLGPFTVTKQIPEDMELSFDSSGKLNSKSKKELISLVDKNKLELSKQANHSHNNIKEEWIDQDHINTRQFLLSEEVNLDLNSHNIQLKD